MVLQILHVLQQERFWSLIPDDPRQFKEEIALFPFGKTVRLAERVLLGHTGNAERLAGKSGAENIVVGDIGGDNSVDVSDGRLAEVHGVCFLGEFIPIARKHALAARALKCDAKAPDTAEKVDKPKANRLRCR